MARFCSALTVPVGSRCCLGLSVCLTRSICQKSGGVYSIGAPQKCNLAEYEGDVDVDEQLVEALMRVTREVASRLKRWRFHECVLYGSLVKLLFDNLDDIRFRGSGNEYN